jgi:hypothetical protein
MKKTRRKRSKSEMRPEYDFSNGVRGKYANRSSKTTTKLVALDPDVAEIFESSEAVNAALRALAAIRIPKKRKAAR